MRENSATESIPQPNIPSPAGAIADAESWAFRDNQKQPATVIEPAAAPFTGPTTRFDEIVSAWDEPLRCQTSSSPRPCRNPARWLGIDHGCDRRLLCTFHKQRWLKRAWQSVRDAGAVGCPHCDRTFATPRQRATFRAL